MDKWLFWRKIRLSLPSGRRNLTTNGAVLGGIAGGIIGNNSGHGNGAQGALLGSTPHH